MISKLRKLRPVAPIPCLCCRRLLIVSGSYERPIFACTLYLSFKLFPACHAFVRSDFYLPPEAAICPLGALSNLCCLLPQHYSD